MKLQNYLKDTRTTARAFAGQIGRATSTVTRILHGQTMPDPATIRAIMRATGGKVTPNDFFDDDEIDDRPTSKLTERAAP